jgi:orotate phosphoribosyltransferase
MNTSSTREKLKEILIRRAIVWGPVFLSSGEQSDYYFDGKIVTLDAEGSYLVAKMILDMIKSDIENGNVDSIGGLTLGADPIIASTITLMLRQKVFADQIIDKYL